ncbi:Mn2 -dependent serine/threonine protein kinase [Cenarchaeum symbiosum A]|uniref:non-specific serine/threonine protein kinase n=1 Tax=Cenarchaeum symbiosum (strain A) TaxID=414004 RepID=A0RY42_CENSY|nr:Mn2 -dependent serine/threonine protein kinase [Cenarchaeum symbiosum A]
MPVKQTFFINRPSFQTLETSPRGMLIMVSSICFLKSMIRPLVLSNASLLVVSVRMPGPSLSSLQSSCLSFFSPSMFMRHTLHDYNPTRGGQGARLLPDPKTTSKLLPMPPCPVRLLSRGAEGDIYLTEWGSRAAVLKIRRARGYRNADLDARLRKRRTVREAEIIRQARSAGVPVPVVFFVDTVECSITMQHVRGRPVSSFSGAALVRLAEQIGRMAGTLHKNGIMHGDLTTSNFIRSGGTLYAIDFGLSARTDKPEDHAVDLRLFKEILNSAHVREMEKAWKGFLSGYGSAVGAARLGRITSLVAEIEARGRYATVV